MNLPLKDPAAALNSGLAADPVQFFDPFVARVEYRHLLALLSVQACLPV